MTAGEALLIIASLVAIEGLLSADNAMVLAMMVKPLPRRLRRRALLYGIAGAYVLRGLMLLFATVVIRLWWLQLAGGGYLLYLALRQLLRSTRDEPLGKPGARHAKAASFWRTVATVEIVDLAFAVDSAPWRSRSPTSSG